MKHNSSGRQDIELGPKPRGITPRNDLDSILDTQYDKADSQESILGPSKTQNAIQAPADRSDRIMRVQEVSISYDQDISTARSKDHPANWRPMK